MIQVNRVAIKWYELTGGLDGIEYLHECRNSNLELGLEETKVEKVADTKIITCLRCEEEIEVTRLKGKGKGRRPSAPSFPQKHSEHSI